MFLVCQLYRKQLHRRKRYIQHSLSQNFYNERYNKKNRKISVNPPSCYVCNINFSSLFTWKKTRMWARVFWPFSINCFSNEKKMTWRKVHAKWKIFVDVSLPDCPIEWIKNGIVSYVKFYVYYCKVFIRMKIFLHRIYPVSQVDEKAK